MLEYDIVLLGETPFTFSLKKETEKKLKVLLLRNSCFSREFSAVQFPGKCFIPQALEAVDLFGQVAGPQFRMDLISDQEALGLLFREELREPDESFGRLSLSSAQEINLINRLIIENFGFGIFRILRENYRDILRNPGDYLRLNSNRFSGRGSLFSLFFEGLKTFFAPGEQNPGYFSKYLLYSLISKKAYIPEFLRERVESPANSMENDILEKIEIKHEWRLHLNSGKTLQAKMLISALSPHILTDCSVRHDFETDYSQCFHEITFRKPVLPPEGMADELVYMDNDGACFVRNNGDTIALYLPAPLHGSPDTGRITTVMNDLCPHAAPLPEFHIRPHIYPFYTAKPKRTFKEDKNIYFLRNYEYPFTGIDGEIIYQRRLVECIWKRFL